MVFKRKKRQPDPLDTAVSVPDELPVPKYLKPKIFLIDVDDETENLLRSEGYNVCVGSFGLPYKVPQSDSLFPVITNSRMPVGHTEQEIVIVNLWYREILDSPVGEKRTSVGQNDWWCSCSDGVIDPRPRVMVSARSAFDRILANGGIFVVFAAPRMRQKLVFGRKVGWGDLAKEKNLDHDNWSFLSLLSGLRVKTDAGEEISVASFDGPLTALLSKHVKGASFACSVYPFGSMLEGRWLPLAYDKYDNPVGELIFESPQAANSGFVLILPAVHNRSRFVSRLLGEVLPEMRPHLFPYVEGGRWVHRVAYELPKVLDIQDQIRRIREEAEQRIVELEAAIEERRTKMGYLYDLLRETGAPLVCAVKQALEVLGFERIVDADEEVEKSGGKDFRREDLQVWDTLPILLVEVKGISNLPKDEDALQAIKYVAPRMREWDRTDIQALSIINHERHLPALGRQNDSVFRADILTNAERQSLGLMTTWDLYRLTRSFLKNKWQSKDVKPVFYRTGRIEPIPENYEFVGVVERFIEKIGVVGVQIEKAEIRQGDRIAFDVGIEFEEQDVESLEVDNASVPRAEAGVLVGIKTCLTKKQAREGVRVFRLTE